MKGLPVKRCKRLRVDQGRTQSSVGQVARISTPRISQIESGHVRPYPIETARLARALGWTGSPADLMDEVDDDD